MVGCSLAPQPPETGVLFWTSLTSASFLRRFRFRWRCQLPSLPLGGRASGSRFRSDGRLLSRLDPPDLSTLVACLSLQDGTHSPALSQLAESPWVWLHERCRPLEARHMKGTGYLLADLLSRSSFGTEHRVYPCALGPGAGVGGVGSGPCWTCLPRSSAPDFRCCLPLVPDVLALAGDSFSLS